jgi:hypothetical protein
MMRALRAQVLREGHQESIQIKQLVPGDIVVLRPGDRVPADLRLVKVDKLYINQGQVTGEVLPAAKNTFPLAANADFIRQKCMAFASTFVTSGTGLGVVVARGVQSTTAQGVKSPTKTHGLKGSIIARRLKRYGVIIRNKRALAVFRKIGIVVIDAKLSDAEIIELVRKVQLTRNIVCKFAVSHADAKRLAAELNVEVYDAETKSGNLLLAQLITGLDTDNSLSVALTLNMLGGNSLWVCDGHQKLRAFSVASISMVVGSNGRDDVIMAADIFAPSTNASILARILYGKNYL